jgi:hypothetical protein
MNDKKLYMLAKINSMFKSSTLKTKEFNFIVFDIESLFKPYDNEDDNKKYVKEHFPFLICYLFISFNTET